MKNKPPIIHLVKSSVSASQKPLSPDDSSNSLQQQLDNTIMKENQLELAAEAAGAGLWSFDLFNPLVNKVFQLGCSFFGEGKSDDGVRRLPLDNQSGNTSRDGLSLARAGTVDDLDVGPPVGR